LALTAVSPYVCKILEIIRESDDTLYFVSEFMKDGTLYDFITRQKDNGTFIDHLQIKSILSQVLQGLQHIHSSGYMHRDLKPENLLINGNDCKVADFSLARSTHTSCEKKMTTYVSTRWYRAPELLLSVSRYNTAIDTFALGCIMAELYELHPLFPGTGEVQQFYLVLNVLGPIDAVDWPEGARLSRRLGLIDQTPPAMDDDVNSFKKLEHKVPSCQDLQALLLLDNLLKLNPNQRSNATQALDHDYFAPCGSPVMTPPPQRVITAKSTARSRTYTEYEDFDIPLVSTEKEHLLGSSKHISAALCHTTNSFSSSNSNALWTKKMRHQHYPTENHGMEYDEDIPSLLCND
jgi:serine/threonine protein kinase